MMTNREVMSKLTEYFMQQPQDHTCKLLAAMMIDFNRMVNIRKLDESQKEDLMVRVKWNVDQLNEFLKNGPSGDLILKTMDS